MTVKRGSSAVMVGILFVLGLPDLFAIMPESAEARRSMLDYMTERIRSDAEVTRKQIRQRSGDLVFFRTHEQRGSRYYEFRHVREAGGIMETASPGTWIVRRRLEDGAFDQIKVFLQYDEGSFLRLFPSGNSIEMDVEIAGVPLYRGVRVPMTMRRALTAPYAMLRDSTAGTVDWSLLEPDPTEPGYTRIESVVQKLREVLPYLSDADDGAMDAEGRYVYIETLLPQERNGFNCSGFVKWVVDGFYHWKTGDLLPVEPLKRKHRAYRGTSWSGTFEDERDPYFGLDWTRNLALHMHALEHGVDVATLDPGALDVRDVSSAEYIPHVGYRVKDLAHILYRLALAEPGTMYLGSINRSFGEDIVLRQHTHTLVFLPWFDQDGRFRVVVMERNVETGIDSLQRRYGSEFVHLVRIPTHSGFDPVYVGDSQPRPIESPRAVR